ncbi:MULTISPECIES: sigma-70 family RNA polymerase sigma factor [Veillonella]|uniref:sigma-70 family RNA polymerase sigma factor n=1 Tax=Veillonella TaxID=29465 RepID=UPI0003E2468F|nr:MULTISPECIES: sigma-70 family RNA polymerase sigma factor [Veillonella]ETS92423.1 sigma-70, region 4 [Veillonella sp. AS16]
MLISDELPNIQRCQSPEKHTDRPILQTMVCSPEVLASITDENLVRICQRRNMRVQTVLYQPWSPDEIHYDAAQIELCRRYRPLILHYTNFTMNRAFREDLEGYLWAVLVDSIYSYDTEGPVPFAGFVKAGIRYGQMNYFKHQRRQWQREIHLPDTTTDGDEKQLAMDQFASADCVEDEVMNRELEQQLRQRLVWAMSRLTETQRSLLRQVYGDSKSFTAISEELNCSRQAVQQRHERAIRKLRKYLTTDFEELADYGS